MSYFAPEKGEEVDEEDNVIYIVVGTKNLYSRIILGLNLNPCNWIYNLKDYFRWHILRRIPIAIGSIFNRSYTCEKGMLNCFDFKNKDLPKMKIFLSRLTMEEEVVSKINYLILDNERWVMRLYITHFDKDFPCELGWDIQFLPRNIFGRIRYALKYIFGRHNDEQEFEINKKDAATLKGLIAVTRKINEKYERN
jgi:hypothetical protein